MNPSLELTDVTLVHPDGDGTVTALDEVTLRVDPGELVVVTGPSGSGKSSLLAVAGLLQRPGSGAVRIDGTDTAALSPRERATVRRERIGFVFQQSNLVPSLDAVDQLLLAAHLAGHRPARQRERAAALLAQVGLGPASRRRPHQLSGGQRQRVAIARALMNSPQLLLLDEPTSALDAQRSVAVAELLAEVTREHGVATVLVTHDEHLVRYADRHLAMTDGRLGELAALA